MSPETNITLFVALFLFFFIAFLVLGIIYIVLAIKKQKNRSISIATLTLLLLTIFSWVYISRLGPTYYADTSDIVLYRSQIKKIDKTAENYNYIKETIEHKNDSISRTNEAKNRLNEMKKYALEYNDSKSNKDAVNYYYKSITEALDDGEYYSDYSLDDLYILSVVSANSIILSNHSKNVVKKDDGKILEPFEQKIN